MTCAGVDSLTFSNLTYRWNPDPNEGVTLVSEIFPIFGNFDNSTKKYMPPCGYVSFGSIYGAIVGSTAHSSQLEDEHI